MDRPLGPVLDSIVRHVEELIVVRGSAGVWNRWEAMARAKCDVIFTCDDDAVVDVPAVLAAYDPSIVTCNMPDAVRPGYRDGIALVGWGAVFSQKRVYPIGYRLEDGTVPAFVRYKAWCTEQHQPFLDAVFRRECDRVFTGLSPLKLIDVPIQHMPWADGEDRMCRFAHDPVHAESMREIRRRIYAIREQQNRPHLPGA